MADRFKLRLEAKINGDWHAISEIEDSGSQNTGRMRRVADNAVVPMRLIELHGEGSDN